MNKHERLYGLYGITAENLLEDDQRLMQAVEQALSGGMRILQYRDKSTEHARRHRQAKQLSQLCRKHQALFIVNDDIELAKSVGADGVHLGRDDGAIESARNTLGEGAIIGCSCYNKLELAMRAQQLGADYVAFGRFFPSRTKPGAVQASDEVLQRGKAALDIPLCAIGGITLSNAAGLVAQGADMVAVIDNLFGADDIGQQARGYQTIFS